MNITLVSFQCKGRKVDLVKPDNGVDPTKRCCKISSEKLWQEALADVIKSVQGLLVTPKICF